MILFTKTPINKRMKNIIELEQEDEFGSVQGYVYVSSNVYADAVIINNIYDGDLKLLETKFPSVEKHKEVIERFYEMAPEPLFILAPFLSLVDESIDMTELKIEDLYGVLHYISRSISLSNYLIVPESVRTDLTFGRKALKDFRLDWEETLLTVPINNITEDTMDSLKLLASYFSEELGKVLSGTISVAPTIQTATLSVQDVAASNEVQLEDEYEEEEEDPLELFNRLMAEADDADEGIVHEDTQNVVKEESTDEYVKEEIKEEIVDKRTEQEKAIDSIVAKYV